MSLVKLFVAKAIALLHDPPYKSYCIAEALKGKRVDHEEKAKQFMITLIKGTMLQDTVTKEYEDIVRVADIIASGFDRWLIDLAVKTNVISVNAIANIFNPKYCEKLLSPPLRELEDKAMNAAMKLNELIKRVTSSFDISREEELEKAIRIAYTLLYALLEPLCYVEGLPPALADTRVPTHTVIDHVYATASTINLISIKSKQGALDGYLVFIDLPGIHKFVDSARKAGDFWAGSWIISEVTWRLAEAIIDQLGPDVLISPTPRMNPYFYFKYLRKVIRENCSEILDEVERTLKEFLNKIVGHKIPEDIEWQPLIPGTLLLVLPKGYVKWLQNKENIRRYISELYVRSWESLINEVMDSLRGDESIGSDRLKKEMILRRILYEMLKKNENIIKRPPIGIRIFIIDIKEVYDKLVRCFEGDEKACEELGLSAKYIEFIPKIIGQRLRISDLAKVLVFHIALSTYLSRKAKLEKVPIPVPFWIYDKDNDKIVPLVKASSSTSQWIPCSMCGEEPATLILRKHVFRKNGMFEIDYNDEDIERIRSLLDKKVDKETIKEVLKVHFKPGEALGPYCLLKRAVYLYASKHKKGIFFISTEDIALRLYKDLIRKLSRRYTISERHLVESLADSLTNELLKRYKNLSRKDVEEACNFAVAYLFKEVSCDIEEALKKINTLLGKVNVTLSIEGFLDLIAKLIAEEIRKYGAKEEEVLKDYFALIYGDVKGLSEFYEAPIPSFRRKDAFMKILTPRTKYAIVYADGDDVGKIHCGKLLTCDEYAKSLLNVISKYACSKGEGIISKLKDSYTRVCKILKCIHGKNSHIALSPTYKTALSASIMITALKDVVVTSHKLYGMVVFSGGDDLIALIPIDTINNVLAYRKNYEGDNFFHRFNGTPIVSAIPHGKSISVRIVSIFDLMSEEIINANKYLEEEAKKGTWIYLGNKWTKDTLVMSSSRSRTINHIPLRMSKMPVEVTIYEKLRVLLARIHASCLLYIISSSLPYDFELRYDNIKGLLARKLGALERVMRLIFERNITVGIDKKVSRNMISKLLGNDLTISYQAQKIDLYNILFNVLRESPDSKIRVPLVCEIVNLIKLFSLR